MPVTTPVRVHSASRHRSLPADDAFTTFRPGLATRHRSPFLHVRHTGGPARGTCQGRLWRPPVDARRPAHEPDDPACAGCRHHAADSGRHGLVGPLRLPGQFRPAKPRDPAARRTCGHHARLLHRSGCQRRPCPDSRRARGGALRAEFLCRHGPRRGTASPPSLDRPLLGLSVRLHQFRQPCRWTALPDLHAALAAASRFSLPAPRSSSSRR